MDSGSDSFYRPPESRLEHPGDVPSGFGSVELALRGEIEFNIQEIITEAWLLVAGSKATIFGIFFLGGLVSVISQFVSVFVTAGFSEIFPSAAVGAGLLIGMVGGALAAPFNTAVVLYAIRRAIRDPGASFDTLSECFGVFVPIVGVSLLSALLMMAGYVMLIVPGIYLAISYIFAAPLVVEKRMGVWEAMETSRKAVTRCWFRVFGLFLTLGFIGAIGTVFTFGIGLIWILPLFILSIGVAYRNVFGYEGEVA